MSRVLFSIVAVFVLPLTVCADYIPTNFVDLAGTSEAIVVGTITKVDESRKPPGEFRSRSPIHRFLAEQDDEERARIEKYKNASNSRQSGKETTGRIDHGGMKTTETTRRLNHEVHGEDDENRRR